MQARKVKPRMFHYQNDLVEWPDGTKGAYLCHGLGVKRAGRTWEEAYEAWTMALKKPWWRFW